jgi:hypothetical protein
LKNFSPAAPNQEGGARVDQDTIEGKKVATVKDRARLRDLIKNIQQNQNKVEANLNQALGKSKDQRAAI